MGGILPPTQSVPGGYQVGQHFDAQGNLVDANGNIIKTAAQLATEQAAAAQESAKENAQQGGVFGNQTLGTLLTKDNPVAGTLRAADDISNGQFGKAGGDFTQGQTYGSIPIGGNVVPATEAGLGKLPSTVGRDLTDLGNGAATAAGKLVSGIGGALAGAPDPSTAPLDNISGGALQSQQELDAIRRNAEANPTAAPQTGLVQLDQTNIDPLRQRQGVALDALTAAANGTAPSAAEILGKDAANRAAAQAYGTAAALQGGTSSGGAIRQALDAQTQIQGDAYTKMLADRAAEQATARQQLVQGIGNAQQQEGTLATTNANLTQQGNLANQSADINTRSQDINREQNLISGANASQNTAEAAAKAALDAKTQQQANANALKGAEYGAGAGIVSKFVSDEREKKDVRPTDLVQLADEIGPGYTFEYKDPRNGAGLRVGEMAQDVRRAKIGKRLVQLGDDGELELDGANTLGAALAMSAQALREARAARGR